MWRKLKNMVRVMKKSDCSRRLNAESARTRTALRIWRQLVGVKFAHRKCVRHWCNEKGEIICEICHMSSVSGQYLVLLWTYTTNGSLALAAEHNLLEPGYDEYSNNNSSGTEFFRAATLTLLALLFLRHALYLTGGDTDDDLFLLHAGGFLLPCYIVAWAISIL